MGIVPQRTEAIRENHRNIEMKAYGVLTSLILLFSLASAADIQQQLAKENAKLESIRHYINNMKIPLESLGIDLENLQGDGNANTIIDGILSVARAAIVAGGYDNVALPEGSFGFNHTLWPFGRVFGGVRLYNGFFKGMGNINRIGDATAKTEKLTMLLESRVGIVDASLGYSLSITFMDWASSSIGWQKRSQILESTSSKVCSPHLSKVRSRRSLMTSSIISYQKYSCMSCSFQFLKILSRAL